MCAYRFRSCVVGQFLWRVSDNDLGAAGLQALADAPCLPQLRSLDLSGASRPRHSPCLNASLCGARSAPRVCGVRQQPRRSGRPGVADAAGQDAAARTAQPRTSAPRRGPTRPRRSKSRACYVDSPPRKFHICVRISLYVYINVYINASVQSHCMRPCVCHAHLIMLCIHVCAWCVPVCIYLYAQTHTCTYQTHTCTHGMRRDIHMFANTIWDAIFACVLRKKTCHAMSASFSRSKPEISCMYLCMLYVYLY